MTRSAQSRLGLLVRLWRRQGYKCALCDEPVPPSQIHSLTLDHKRPRAHGGSDGVFNLQAAHYKCNHDKADRCDGCAQCQP
jgi:5-methylcytosine-specific restriction endonuclease McrA